MMGVGGLLEFWRGKVWVVGEGLAGLCEGLGFYYWDEKRRAG